jgi:hypothetical protein
VTLVNSDEAVSQALLVFVVAVMLPVRCPVVQHLSDLHVGNGHLLDGIYLQRRRVKHLLDSPRSALKHAERYHLVESEIYHLFHTILFLKLLLNLKLIHSLYRVAVVVGKRAA